MERIADETDGHGNRTDVVVRVDQTMVVPGEMHDLQVTDYQQEGLVLMQAQDIVDKAEVMLKALADELVEATAYGLTALIEQLPVLWRGSCQYLGGDIAAPPIGHLLWVIGNLEKTDCLTVEVCKVEHAQQLGNLDAKGYALKIAVDDLVHETTELACLELVINLLLQDGMIHQGKVMMDVLCEIVPHGQLRILIYLIADEAEHGMGTKTRTHSRRTPADVVIDLLLVGQYSGSLGMMVVDRGLAQYPDLLVVDSFRLIARGLKGLFLNVAENGRNMSVQLSLVSLDVLPGMLFLRE